MSEATEAELRRQLNGAREAYRQRPSEANAQACERIAAELVRRGLVPWADTGAGR